jgi:phospholipid/cholesterol/gamma-HCH transport system substrate-binding protein
MTEVKSGNGIIHKLVYDKQAGKAIDDLQLASANLAAISGQLRNGDGAIPKLINDPAMKDGVFKAVDAIANLNKASADITAAAADLRLVMDRIEKGEGTVGALINDPGVYDDLRALLGRAKRNRVLRGVIRHTIDKNENIEEATPVPAAAPGKKAEK